MIFQNAHVHLPLRLGDHYQRRLPVARSLNILSSTGSNFDNYGTTSHRRQRPVHKLRISPAFLTAEKDTPKLSWQPIYLAWFVLHFLLILIVCTRDTFSLLAEGTVPSPYPLHALWKKADTFTSLALGDQLPDSNPFRQAVATYTQVSGIDAGYGYFAPNIPDSYKLVFELHYPDGSVGYDLPNVAGSAGGLRIIGLLDEVGRATDGTIRAAMIRTLAHPIWEEHHDAISIRAVFGAVKQPTLSEYKSGKRDAYEVMGAYDFSFIRHPLPHP